MQRSDPRYRAALSHLFDRINYEKSTDQPYTKNNFKLGRMAYLLELLGNPHLAAPVVHIAGTKGKGSVSWLLAEAFRRSGLKTGLYTSPHLVDIEERFMIDSQAISPYELVEIVEQMQSADAACAASPHGKPTFFELATAIGWLAFKNHKTQVNVIEVGLGGRLDSTNVCSPALCIITSISYDHQQQLGNTLAQIASEKAGIIKPSIDVICGARTQEAYAVIQQKAIDQGSPLKQLGRDFDVRWTPNPRLLWSTVQYTDRDTNHSEIPETSDAKKSQRNRTYTLRMLGKHQADNAAIAIAAWDKLRDLGWTLSDAALTDSLASTQVPARLEILSQSPHWILDTAHNEASIDALVEALESYFPETPKSVIFACSKDKKALEMLERLCKFVDRIILTQYRSNPRFTPVERLVQIAAECQKNRCEILAATDLQTALAMSRRPMACGALSQGAVHVITGSFFIAAEAKSYFALEGHSDIKLSDF
jgi:dihydrofolate synthase/folylpolyglutamate synthase